MERWADQCDDTLKFGELPDDTRAFSFRLMLFKIVEGC